MSNAYLASSSFDLFIETDELLQTTNLQASQPNRFESIEHRKSLIMNGSTNSCSLIDDKQNIQSGESYYLACDKKIDCLNATLHFLPIFS